MTGELRSRVARLWGTLIPKLSGWGCPIFTVSGTITSETLEAALTASNTLRRVRVGWRRVLPREARTGALSTAIRVTGAYRAEQGSLTQQQWHRKPGETMVAYRRTQQWPRSCTHLTPLSTKSPHAPAASASAPGSPLHAPSKPKNISTPNGDIPANTDGATLSRKHA